ncbi:MAG: macro domain-containing protein [Acidobacteria bacterium]|nr:macro domain-containing protein [Acidobacteriota bacterium]
MAEIESVVGDLLDQRVEVIVNPWNRNFIPWWLLLPQGVSGAIKRRAGSQPFREIARVGVLRPGEARLTTAGRLPFRGIIHVAALNGIWRSSPAIIESCVIAALNIASSHDFASVGFPLLGAGTGGVSTAVAEATILSAVDQVPFEGQVRIVVFEPSSGPRRKRAPTATRNSSLVRR